MIFSAGFRISFETGAANADVCIIVMIKEQIRT
jgi:hypothetical protein